MRVVIFGAGSRGDVQPCVRLGKALADAGFEVCLAVPHNFKELVLEEDLSFHPLRGDVQAVMSGEDGKEFLEAGDRNPLRSILAMRRMLRPIALEMMEDALEACRRADALILPAVFAPIGKTVSELLHLPMILIEPTPMLPAGEFPAPGWPIQENLGRPLNRWTGTMMVNLVWQWYRPFVNEFRARFGLRALTGRDFLRTLRATPLVGAYSSAVLEPSRDWPDSVWVTGYWFMEPSDWRPSAELASFLKGGEAPVYIGFGSMTGRSPELLADIALGALARTGRRGIIATGWSGAGIASCPENVFILDAAPHGWLFPRMSAVVHHGGAGTTAEGLRAGKPTLIVPFIVDQRFWGKRVWELGAGPKPIPASRLTVANLAEGIEEAITNPGIRDCAERLGKAIRSEDGLAEAVTLIKRFLGVDS